MRLVYHGVTVVTQGFLMGLFWCCVSRRCINIFMETIDQMTTCNVKGVASSDKPRGNYRLPASVVPLNSTEYLSVFQLIVLLTVQQQQCW